MLQHGGGAIVNMGSIASLVGVPERFAYSMTKGAVLTMTMSIALDYVKRGIRCNCICPARIQTPFVEGYLREHYPGPRGRDAARVGGLSADWAHGAHRKRLPRWRSISAPTKRRSSPVRPTRSTAASWSHDILRVAAAVQATSDRQ